MAARRWRGSPHTACELCGDPPPESGEAKFYDASIRSAGGAWGKICPRCFERHGCRLGTGLGQEYTRQPDGIWLKTGG